MSGPAVTAGIEMRLARRNVLWLVLARSGSKSIPGKNIRPLAGVPLLAYRVRAARMIAPQDAVWISTDSPEYARIARAYGACAPFLRPQKLSGDRSRSEDAVLHAMDYCERSGKIFDAIGILEPTSPFIYPRQLSRAVRQLFADSKAQSIVAVRESRPNSYFVQNEAVYLFDVSRRVRKRLNAVRRQDFRPEVTPSGGFYIAKWSSFRKFKTVYAPYTLAYKVPDINGLEIDEPLDWLWAEFLIKQKHIRLSEFGLT